MVRWRQLKKGYAQRAMHGMTDNQQQNGNKSNQNNMTQNQQQIVDGLIAEFNRMNLPTKSSDGRKRLIDKDEIDGVISQSAKMKAEIEANNLAWVNHVRELSRQAVDLLNKDLEDMGLISTFQDNDWYPCFHIKKPGYPYGIRFEYAIGSENVYLPNKESIYKKTNVKFLNVSSNWMYGSVSFTSLNDACNDERVKDSIRNLYQVKIK